MSAFLSLADMVERDMVTHSMLFAQQKPTAENLLIWYDRHARILPWRALTGEATDPYRVWLSEIMLQQTTVQAVKPYFEAFTLRWPKITDLAAAPVEDIMKMWAGLGYYSRARNLHACARKIVEQFNGIFPPDEKSLLTLPGVGAYTAAAISSIAFAKRAVVVDGNVERVISRLHRVEDKLPAAKTTIKWLADQLTPTNRPGDFAQAMMDLGATVCTPRKPACGICPFLGACDAQHAGDAETYPRKAPKSTKITRYGAAFVAVRTDGALLVRTRPPKGLLGGMTEIPGSEWTDKKWTGQSALIAVEPLRAVWEQQSDVVRHVFTHFPLELTVFKAEITAGVVAPAGMRWISANEIAGEAFPTVFRKVLQVASL
jgi:A/G-specific adenine glycosylase